MLSFLTFRTFLRNMVPRFPMFFGLWLAVINIAVTEYDCSVVCWILMRLVFYEKTIWLNYNSLNWNRSKKMTARSDRQHKLVKDKCDLILHHYFQQMFQNNRIPKLKFSSCQFISLQGCVLKIIFSNKWTNQYWWIVLEWFINTVISGLPIIWQVGKSDYLISVFKGIK